MENLTEKRELSSQEFKDILTGKLLKNKNYADFYESSHLFEYSILIQNCIISDSEILIENETLEYPIILGENTVIEIGFRCKNCYFEAITFRGAIFESSINLNGIFNKVDVENIYCKSSFRRCLKIIFGKIQFLFKIIWQLVSSIHASAEFVVFS